jgi:hypothetical protein
MADEPRPLGGGLSQPQAERPLRASVTQGTRTPANDTTAGFVLSLLGLLASLYPGDLLVALPFLLAGLYLSIISLRAGGNETTPGRLPIAGILLGLLGLIVTVLLFAFFIA